MKEKPLSEMTLSELGQALKDAIYHVEPLYIEAIEIVLERRDADRAALAAEVARLKAYISRLQDDLMEEGGGYITYDEWRRAHDAPLTERYAPSLGIDGDESEAR